MGCIFVRVVFLDRLYFLDGMYFVLEDHTQFNFALLSFSFFISSAFLWKSDLSSVHKLIGPIFLCLFLCGIFQVNTLLDHPLFLYWKHLYLSKLYIFTPISKVCELSQTFSSADFHLNFVPTQQWSMIIDQARFNFIRNVKIERMRWRLVLTEKTASWIFQFFSHRPPGPKKKKEKRRKIRCWAKSFLRLPYLRLSTVLCVRPVTQLLHKKNSSKVHL